MVTFPEQYKETIEQFLREYYERRKWEIEQGFLGVILPILTDDVVHGSALADQLAEIAQAAVWAEEGKEWNDWTAGVTYEGIQDLAERLFAPPGLYSAYTIPDEFWEHPLGQMVGRAFIWCQNDRLITQAEAAELRGVTTQVIHNAIKDGRLRGYHDPEAKQRQGRTLVSKKEVEKIIKNPALPSG